MLHSRNFAKSRITLEALVSDKECTTGLLDSGSDDTVIASETLVRPIESMTASSCDSSNYEVPIGSQARVRGLERFGI